jgi:tripartite-type tricarboxylate transporter receptor subunit TctC
MRFLCGVLFFALSTAWLLADDVFSQEAFYKEKTITIIQGREPGGTGDMRVRAVISFLRKYILDSPTS